MLFCSVAPQVCLSSGTPWLLASLHLGCLQLLSCGHLFVSLLRPPPLAPPQPAAGLPASGKLEAGPNPGKPGFGWGGECTDYAATDLRRAERPRPPF